ncbi:MAG TPA: hypothetical protein ENI06_03045 [Spirochaetales bacterium]|nr:hypothetical protein [Spirochaetales bacterium]
MKNKLSGRIAQSIFMGNITDLFVEVAGKTIRAQNLKWESDKWKKGLLPVRCGPHS